MKIFQKQNWKLEVDIHRAIQLFLQKMLNIFLKPEHDIHWMVQLLFMKDTQGVDYFFFETRI